ncbi:hypothetical protein EUGRSUZ_K02298 [Eucalyptus grandis]|uniref:Uncharacterized protein n=2 Tax=Eucalyptus grandis TaxID=71139 RepID=A0ACC3IY41_EUCGR|nr:hypothetical protein EUGRSUZ_K02298 [Eucalyptus grandis]
MSEDVLLLIRSAIIQVLFLPNNEQRRAFWPKSASHFQHQRRNNQQIKIYGLKFKRETERKGLLTSFVEMICFNFHSSTVPRLICLNSSSMFHLLEDGSHIATFTQFAFVLL